MNFIRRVLMVLGIAGAAGAILRLKGRSEPSSSRGGWRPMPPLDGESADPSSAKQ
ncbi:MAG: hypothetical protein RL623_180 [Actinomycetota bacterium]|jgi:hypothetical protein